jgi:hypothetical protein
MIWVSLDSLGREVSDGMLVSLKKFGAEFSEVGRPHPPHAAACSWLELVPHPLISLLDSQIPEVMHNFGVCKFYPSGHPGEWHSKKMASQVVASSISLYVSDLSAAGRRQQQSFVRILELLRFVMTVQNVYARRCPSR